RPVFGALQLEGRDLLDETELVFINAVANQLAIAVDRQATIDTLQQRAEAKRIDAEQRRAAAESERGQAQQASHFARAQQVRAEAERDAANVGRAASETRRTVAEALRDRYE